MKKKRISEIKELDAKIECHFKEAENAAALAGAPGSLDGSGGGAPAGTAVGAEVAALKLSLEVESK